jgi:septum formation protein
MADTPLILASSSSIRLQLLKNAGVTVTAAAARIDESAVRLALAQEDAKPRDVADTLAELKARKIADRNPASLVLGCDQVLAVGDDIWSKPETMDEARDQLRSLSGRMHHLLSALVLYHNAQPIWRHVGTAKMTMRPLGEDYIQAYVSRNWPDVSYSVGAYQIEREGIRLFSEVEGDYFTILGLPLFPLLSYLSLRGFIES